MKKLIALMLAVVFITSVVGCGDSKPSSGTGKGTGGAPSAPPAPPKAP